MAAVEQPEPGPARRWLRRIGMAAVAVLLLAAPYLDRRLGGYLVREHPTGVAEFIATGAHWVLTGLAFAVRIFLRIGDLVSIAISCFGFTLLAAWLVFVLTTSAEGRRRYRQLTDRRAWDTVFEFGNVAAPCRSVWRRGKSRIWLRPMVLAIGVATGLFAHFAGHIADRTTWLVGALSLRLLHMGTVLWHLAFFVLLVIVSWTLSDGRAAD